MSHPTQDPHAPQAPPAAGWSAPPPQGWSPPSWPPTPPAAPPTGPPPAWGPPPADHDPARPTLGLQNLLLGLGTALVAIALIVFTAVNWRRLDATFQGLVLVALTVVAAVASRLSKQRDMPASAEAMGLVAVLLALADVHAFRVGLAPRVDPDIWWAAGLLVVSVGAWLLGQGGVRAPRVAAAVLGQWPLLLVIQVLEASSTVRSPGLAVQAVLVLQGAAVVTAAARLRDMPRWGRILGSGQAIVVVAGITVGLAIDALPDGDSTAYELAIGLVLAAAFSLLIARLRAESEPVRSVGLLAASSLGLAAAAVAAAPEHGVPGALAALSLAGALLASAALRLPDRWGQVPRAIAASGLLLGSVNLLSSLSSMLVAASRVADRVWHLDVARHAASLQLPEAEAAGAAVIAAHLLALAIVVVGAGRMLRPAGRSAALGTLALVTMVALPLVVPLSILATALSGTGVALAASMAAWLVRRRRSDLAVAMGVAGAAFAWSLAWAIAAPALTVGVLAGGALAALVAAVAAVSVERSELALPAAGWFAAAVAGAAGSAAAAWGSTAPVAWCTAGVTAAVLAVIGVLLLDPDDQAGPAVRSAVLAGEVVAAAVHVVALGVVIDRGAVDPASVALATGAVTSGVLAARSSRRPLVALAALEALVLVWLRLGHAGVRLVEAYTVPLAALLLVVGVVADRRARRGGAQLASWLTLGPALVVALAPTTLLGLAEPGSLRPLIGLVAGALVLVAGALTGRRAAVDVGAAAVVALGLRQLAPVAAELPNWVAIGLTGMVLLAVGATFEQRRRDLRVVRDRYSALR